MGRLEIASLPLLNKKKNHRCFLVGNACIERITKGGLIPPTSKYDERRRPSNGRPRGGSGAVIKCDSKNALPSEDQNEAAGRPQKGGGLASDCVTNI